MSNYQAVLVWVNLISCLFLTLLAARLWYRYRDTRGLIAFPGLWGLAGVVYYLLILLERLSIKQILLLGAVHRLLGIIMVLMFLLGLYALARNDARK